jgi:hypothetical protein
MNIYEYNDLTWKYFRMNVGIPETRKKVWREGNEEVEISYLWVPIELYERNEKVEPYFSWLGRYHHILSWYNQEQTDYIDIDFQNPCGLDFLTQLEEKIEHIISSQSEEWFKKRITIHQLDSLLKSAIRWNHKQNILSIRAKYYDRLFPNEWKSMINPKDTYHIQLRCCGVEIYQQSWNLLIEVMNIQNVKWLEEQESVSEESFYITDTPYLNTPILQIEYDDLSVFETPIPSDLTTQESTSSRTLLSIDNKTIQEPMNKIEETISIPMEKIVPTIVECVNEIEKVEEYIEKKEEEKDQEHIIKREEEPIEEKDQEHIIKREEEPIEKSEKENMEMKEEEFIEEKKEEQIEQVEKEEKQIKENEEKIKKEKGEKKKKEQRETDLEELKKTMESVTKWIEGQRKDLPKLPDLGKKQEKKKKKKLLKIPKE